MMILFCKQDQTDLNTKTIERKLNHVLDMGHRIIELYRHITCTEHAALLLAMTTAVRQASNNIQNVAVLLRQTCSNSGKRSAIYIRSMRRR